MPLLTKDKCGLVYHILPTSGEMRRDGRLTPAGYADAHTLWRRPR